MRENMADQIDTVRKVLHQILLVDDHNMVRYGIRRILQELLSVPVQIEEASTGLQAISMNRKCDFDLVLLDISLPDRNGLEVLKQLCLYCPNTRVIILSMHSEQDYAIRAFRAGASGYLAKAHAKEELVQAVEKVLQGGQYISPVVAELFANEIKEERTDAPLHRALSSRELQVACMISRGMRPTEIADTLNVSIKTISTYRARLLEKLRIKTNADIINYCRDNNLTM